MTTTLPLPSHTHTVDLHDTASLSVREEGRGPALLLISGLGGTASFWQPCMTSLTTYFRVISFDQRGIGLSTRGSAPCSIDQLAEDCLAVLDYCEVKQAIVVGHSTGGCIAQTLALRAPERIAACVFSATWAKANTYHQTLFSIRQNMLFCDPIGYACSSVFMGYDATWLNQNWQVLDQARRHAPLTPHAQNIISERISALTVFDRSAEVCRIQAPQLILGARDDLIVPFFLQEELATYLDRAEIHMFDSGGHFFPITRTDLFIPLVLEWLRAHRLFWNTDA